MVHKKMLRMCASFLFVCSFAQAMYEADEIEDSSTQFAYVPEDIQTILISLQDALDGNPYLDTVVAELKDDICIIDAQAVSSVVNDMVQKLLPLHEHDAVVLEFILPLLRYKEALENGDALIDRESLVRGGCCNTCTKRKVFKKNVLVKCKLTTNQLQVCSDATIGGNLTVEGKLIGPDGVLGLLGLQGIQGIVGVEVPQGTIGLIGPQGFQGIPGVQGLVGVGSTGAVGLVGPEGIMGIPGIQGLVGIQGPQGGIGLVGPQGTTGIPGLQGLVGVAGTAGAIGLIGPQGITGIPGIQGLIGIQGVTGPIGIIGPMGFQGITGIPGVEGPTGPIGPTGPAGSFGAAEFIDTSGADNVSVSPGDAFLIPTQVYNNIPLAIAAVSASGGTVIQFSETGTYVLDYEMSLLAAGSVGIYTGANAGTLALDTNTVAGSSTAKTWIHGRAFVVVTAVPYYAAISPAVGLTTVTTAGNDPSSNMIRLTILKVA